MVAKFSGLLLLVGAQAPALQSSVAPSHPDAQESTAGAAVSKALEDVFEGSDIPGGVAALARVGEPLSIGAFGVRKAGSDAPFLTTDLVHIGSDTKAMTAVLCARLVESGDLAWDVTIGDALPELAKEIHGGYRDATLLQLLRHSSGVPENAARWSMSTQLELRERRRAIALDSLKSAPAAAPGEQYLYSNVGYMLAGMMAEAARDATWEELLIAEVAKPLGLESLGFGAQGEEGKLDQPWGHASIGKALFPVQSDNAEALGPAGTVHLSLSDWARFALSMTEAGRVEGFLKDASYRQLLEPGLQGYACGWGVYDRKWAGGLALAHAGSNTFWFAQVWVAPKSGRAYMIAVNAAPEGVASRCDQMIGKLLALDAAAAAGDAGERAK